MKKKLIYIILLIFIKGCALTQVDIENSVIRKVERFSRRHGSAFGLIRSPGFVSYVWYYQDSSLYIQRIIAKRNLIGGLKTNKKMIRSLRPHLHYLNYNTSVCSCSLINSARDKLLILRKYEEEEKFNEHIYCLDSLVLRPKCEYFKQMKDEINLIESW